MFRKAIATVVLLCVTATAFADWPAKVKGHVPPKPGEHPRLLFRKSDLPELRKRAQTPAGKMLIERTIYLLDGADHVREGDRYTMFDAAAFGFLYQITGEKKYADLAKQSQDKLWTQGTLDRDKRYSLVPPNEPMRAGPSLYAAALAYDLCYDAWDADYRKDQAQKIFTYRGKSKKRGGEISLERMALKPDNPNPVSNHFALQVGGAGLSLLALQGDPELTREQHATLEKWMGGVRKNAIKVMTEDFGESGYFGEHAGPGVIATTWTFLPWLAAERIAGGRDWLSDPKHTAAEWISLRFVMETLPSDRGPVYTNPIPMGGYGTEYLVQNGGHHATYWSQGLGAVQPQHRAAMLWVYENFVEPTERTLYADELPEGQKSFDAFNYPHRTMQAFINWPFNEKPVNPETVIPKFKADTHYGRFVFRNRWQDANDTIVATLFGARTSDRGVARLMVWGLGQRMTFGNIGHAIQGSGKIGVAKIDAYQGFEDGSGAVAAGGNIVGVDFSKASGADTVVVIVGPGASEALEGDVDPTKSKVQTVDAGGKTFAILTLSESGTHPTAEAAGSSIKLGDQTISVDGTLVKFAKAAKPIKD
jgi:hypothetical protein